MGRKKPEQPEESKQNEKGEKKNGHGNNRQRIRTLGPVGNLEEHVSSDWWCRIFNSLYLKTDADVVDDQKITATEIDIIADILDLQPKDRILDLCCGQGRHSLELARRNLRNVEGLDRSHFLISKARERAKSEGLAVKFREGDARKLPYPADSFDVVCILGNSFGYFETLQDDFKVLKEVIRILKPWGRLLIDIADGSFLKNNFQKRSWEWIDRKLFVCRERSLSLDEDRLVSREVITHVDKGIIADQFYAERLYSQESIKKLLEEAGFSSVAFPIELTPDSKRAQDLGMMERRIITTAHVRKDWAPFRQRSRKAEKHVVVVMGDPNKPDKLKPKSVFDDDDFYTIDKMKEALRELEGYRFTYLSNHDTLFADLSKLVGKADYAFNLCDEGYLNDPHKELHVPSMFEMLGMPFTGSGPQCLAFCYDKSLVHGAAKQMGIPTPASLFVKPEDTTFEVPFGFPVLVKPNLGDSSFGITAASVAHNPEELINAIQGIRQAFGYEKPVLVEEFLTGKDLTVGIIGTPPSNYTALPISEEDYSVLPPDLPQICGYEAKWCPDTPYWKIKSKPAELPDKTEKAIIEWCVKLAERLECRDYTRFDWRLDSEGMPKLLEVNPNPGWCWDGHLAKMCAYAGISYKEMLQTILHVAEVRMGIEDDGLRRENGKPVETHEPAVSKS
jgi:D-alanine-D-alanine ligase